MTGMQFSAYAGGDLLGHGRKKTSPSANPGALVRRQDRMNELENNFDLNL